MSSNIFEQKTATTGPLTKACPYLKYKVNGQNFIVIANFFVNIWFPPFSLKLLRLMKRTDAIRIPCYNFLHCSETFFYRELVFNYGIIGRLMKPKLLFDDTYYSKIKRILRKTFT